jgi:multiple sugar transport system ATP-binding protein
VGNVTLERVTKRYGDNEVITDLDLTVDDREFMVLVGPSGCGKSTVLRMIAGLEEITAGTISINERVVNDIPPKDRDIAMVFQSYALYPHMNVRENLEFGLRMRKMDRAERNRRVGEAAEILGLDELLERKPRQLSGGQRQRVAVGRAIVRQPQVFLFDEPLSNLDAKLRVQMRAEITGLQRQLQTTTIYVTHDQVEAMTMGSRIAVLDAGELKQVGTPLQLYEHPDNLFVARFIGTPPMNILPANLEGGGTRLRSDHVDLPIPEQLRPVAGTHDGRKVLVGIRPENLQCSRTDARSADMVAGAAVASITVKVAMVESLGHEMLTHGRLGEEDVIAKVDPHQAPAVGDELQLTVVLEKMHLFDQVTEQRLLA